MSRDSWHTLSNDFNSPYIRNYIWTLSGTLYSKFFGFKNPHIGIASSNNNIEYIYQNHEWKKLHLNMIDWVNNDLSKLDKLISKTNKAAEEFNKWTEENLLLADYKKISNKTLLSRYKKFIEGQAKLYCLGVALAVLDYGDYSFIEGNFNKFLKSKVKGERFKEYYRILTESPYDSFSKKQNRELMKIILKFNKTSLAKDIKQKSFFEITKKYPEFYRAIQKHTKKYAWVYYVYAGPAFKEIDFFEMIENYLHKRIDIANQLKLEKQQRTIINKEKNQIIAELKPDQFNLQLMKFIGKFIWAKPHRKDYQSKSYYHAEKIQKEIGRRLYLSVDQVRSMPIDLLEDFLLNDREPDSSICNQVYNSHVCLLENNKIKTLSGREADVFIEKLSREDVLIEKGTRLCRGICARSGKANGEVKIINNFSEVKKMNNGDVLVSVATTPSIVLAMQKASAIITDEGGLACHAAIVARELGIPCIVGTKLATKILNDGDQIFVDASHGVFNKM